MTENLQSCLVSRLSRFIALTDHERAFVAELEKDERAVRKGHHLAVPGEPSQGLVILKTGWAVVKSESPDGRSQILRIYLPGEVVGLAEIGATRASHSVMMQTEGVICPFPRRGLGPLITECPRLAALLIAVGSMDEIALRYHASSLGLMDGPSKLKFFLLQLRSRLSVANVGLGNKFKLPLSQAEIGQAVGMTSIYVNKLLRSFVASGELQVDRPYFRLLAREAWEAETAFVDAFKEMDTSWFPPDKAFPDGNGN